MASGYFQDVYACVRMIPHGRVTTYGAIADYLGLGSARMVGWALNKSFTNGIDVPAHRVVNRMGELSGRNHFFSPTLMQELLENEGIVIKEHKIVDFHKHFWHPARVSE